MRNRAGRERTLGTPGGTSADANRAVMAGLTWLARAQERDGSWSCERWDGREKWDVGVTSLALLAFLGAGYTHTKGQFKATVARGLNWLRENQRFDGSFQWRTFYEQGLAAMALCEAYALTRSPAIGRLAQRAIDYICRVQPEHGGFRYAGSVAKDQGDLSVSGWQMMAMAAGMCAGLEVPQEAVQRSLVLLKNTYLGDGRSAYLVKSDYVSPSMTAVGMLCRQFLGGPDAEIAAAAHYLLKHQTRHKRRAKTSYHLVGDLYYTYYSCLAMFQMGGKRWARWNRLYRDLLVEAQIEEKFSRGRFARGSWHPKNHRFGSAGGRIYTTAMAILCLETPYRYARFYKAAIQKPAAP